MRIVRPQNIAGLLAILASLILTLGGCAEEEVAGNACKPGQACEQALLYQCDCCEPDKVQACKSKVSSNCANGNYVLNISVDQCKTNNSYFAQNGTDMCLEVDASTLDQHCQ